MYKKKSFELVTYIFEVDGHFTSFGEVILQKPKIVSVKLCLPTYNGFEVSI